MAKSNLSVVQLRCEYLDNPLGINEPKPRLSWVLESSRRSQMQSAYQVLASSSEKDLKGGRGELWDSGRVESDQSTHVVYEGKPLESSQRAYWQVRVWDQEGNASDYSDAAYWEFGLSQGDWQGKWIAFPTHVNNTASAPCPHVRKLFTAKKKVARARAYASALGLYQLHINGQRVGNDVFTPGWTEYSKRVQYQTYDVTDLIERGKNGVGIIIGDGWYCGSVGWFGRNHWGPLAHALLQLRIEYADGTVETVVTDGTWEAGTGPLLTSDLLNGEEYDARLAIPGWSTTRFDDSDWKPVKTQDLGTVPLLGQHSQPVQEVLELEPKKITQNPTGSYIFDLGQNMVGWARLKVKGPAGTIVRLRFAEMLNPDGTLYTMNLRKAKCTDVYTLRGGRTEVYEPTFSFRGFRYVEVTGYPGKPPRDAITGVVAYSNTPPTGTFECSNPMVNQLQSNIVWGQRGNFLEVPTDCPQRDERAGWMGDAQIFVRTACFNMDVSSFFTKWMDDVVDSQSPEGAFGDVSPRVKPIGDAAPAWGDAGVIIPWTMYLCYGDTRVIEKHWAAMVKWMDYIAAENPSFVRDKRLNNNYGDWLSIAAETPKDLLATAYWAYLADLMAKMAHVIGKQDEARQYDELFAKVKSAFNRAFVKEDGKIGDDTQTGYVLALHWDLLPQEKREAAARHLVADIERKGGHLSTGFLGVGYLTPTLTEVGRLDVAYRLLNNRTFPSWGYSIKHGATTIWERWDGWTTDKGFQDPGMNSFNHYSLGSVGEWMYHTVAGIDVDPHKPGYKHIILHPRPGGGLTYAKAAYDSIHGRIVSNWRLRKGKFEWKVAIPANTTATLYIPAESEEEITESGESLGEAEGVRFVRMEEGFAVCEAASGEYQFVTGQVPALVG